jgi:hypothetical protein
LFVDFFGFRVLWIQLSFWDSAYKPRRHKIGRPAGVILRIVIGKWQVFHWTILPMTNWHWHYAHPWRRKYLGWIFNPWHKFVWFIAKRFVDRRYDKKWDKYVKADRNRWAGETGNQLLEFKPFTIPSLTIPFSLQAELTGALPVGRGCLEFKVCGSPKALDWHKAWVKRGMGWPYCRIGLWIDDITEIKEGKQLSSYGGELWPSAWPAYFRADTSNNKNSVGAVYLTRLGAELLMQALQ